MNRCQKISGAILLLILVAPVVGVSGSPEGANQLAASLHKLGVDAALKWTAEHGDLQCTIAAPTARTAERISCYTFTDGSVSSVGEYSLKGAGLLYARPLAVGDIPLLVVSVSGSGYLLDAFAFDGKQIKRIWQDGSYLEPELVLSSSKKYQPLLVLSDATWLTDSSGARTKAAGTARIIEWDGTGFQTRRSVKWSDRLTSVEAVQAGR